MTETSPLPRYSDDLSTFLGDLRSAVFSSQSKIARHLQLSHTTISRYENGNLKPASGYIAYLAYLLNSNLSGESTAHKQHLLGEINKALRWNYTALSQLQDWDELSHEARTYMSSRSGKSEPTQLPLKYVSWGQAPDVTVMYGRDAELQKLQDWILGDQSRIVMLVGMGGIGKTVMATRLAHQLVNQFDYIVWRSLRNAPTLDYTLLELSSSLLTPGDGHVTHSIDQQILRLLEFFQQNNCLIVLDNLESILGADQYIGSFRPGYEAYQNLFSTVANSQHNSCLLLTSREIPAEFATYSDDRSNVRIFQVSGLSSDAAEKILLPRGVSGTPETVHVLNQLYSGNPLALKFVAETITTFFGGQIDRFLEQQSIVFGDIRRLLDQSWSRISDLVREVAYCIAIAREPLSLPALRERLLPGRPIAQVLDALQSLKRACLIEYVDDMCYLPNVVSEYVIDYLRELIHQELTDNDLTTIHKVALLTTDSADHVRQTQKRMLVSAVAKRLIDEVGDHYIRVKFEKLIECARRPRYSSPNYAPGNLLNIMSLSGQQIRDYDFSKLHIKHAYLISSTLLGVDFTDAHFSHCLFDSTFIGVNTVALSHQAQFVALASGKEIRIWRLSDRHPYRILHGHLDMIWNLAFSADANFLFSRDMSNTTYLWNIEESEIVFSYQHTEPLYCMAVNGDGSFVATGSDSGMIVLWEVGGAHSILKIDRKYNVKISALAFDRSGHYLAAGCSDGTIALWQLPEGKPKVIADGHEQSVTALSFMPDSPFLVSGSADYTIKIWNQSSLHLHKVLLGHSDLISGVKACPDGKVVSSAYDKSIIIWHISQDKPLIVLRGHSLPVSAIDVDKTGNILVSGSYDRTIRLWDTRDGHLIDSITGLTSEFRALAFSPDSQYLAAGSTDYHCYVWNWKSGVRIRTYKGHARWVGAVAFSPDGELVASGSYDRTVRLWSVHHDKELAVLRNNGHWIVCLRFSPDRQYVAAASVDQTICVWSMYSLDLIHAFRGHTDIVNCTAFHPQDAILASGSKDGTVRLWNLESGDAFTIRLEFLVSVDMLDFAPDGETLVIGLQDGQIYVWDYREERIVSDWRLATEHNQLTTLHTGKNLIAGYGASRTIGIYDITKGRQLAVLHPEGGKVSSLAYDGSGDYLASGSTDGWLNIWQIPDGTTSKVLKMNHPYEGMNICGAMGISPAQREMLKSLGAVE